MISSNNALTIKNLERKNTIHPRANEQHYMVGQGRVLLCLSGGCRFGLICWLVFVVLFSFLCNCLYYCVVALIFCAFWLLFEVCFVVVWLGVAVVVVVWFIFSCGFRGWWLLSSAVGLWCWFVDVYFMFHLCLQQLFWDSYVVFCCWFGCSCGVGLVGCW